MCVLSCYHLFTLMHPLDLTRRVPRSRSASLLRFLHIIERHGAHLNVSPHRRTRRSRRLSHELSLSREDVAGYIFEFAINVAFVSKAALIIPGPGKEKEGEDPRAHPTLKLKPSPTPPGLPGHQIQIAPCSTMQHYQHRTSKRVRAQAAIMSAPNGF